MLNTQELFFDSSFTICGVFVWRSLCINTHYSILPVNVLLVYSSQTSCCFYNVCRITGALLSPWWPLCHLFYWLMGFPWLLAEFLLIISYNLWEWVKTFLHIIECLNIWKCLVFCPFLWYEPEFECNFNQWESTLTNIYVRRIWKIMWICFVMQQR